MCGIAGLWTAQAGSKDLVAIARAMTDTIAHRGPDGSGIWADSDAGVALGHRRLAIVELSEAGAQPMVSASGRYMITFNGEVYNFQRLRQELPGGGHGFRGNSDTEVMLACFEAYGVKAALSRFVGMFAFALWDRQERTLFLACDRLGKKPIFYSHEPKGFWFGSELKALHSQLAHRWRIDSESLTDYLRYQYVPAPHTIIQGIAKMMPGELLTVRQRGTELTLERESYWRASDSFGGLPKPGVESAAERLERLEDLLCDAVRIRMVADVPLGAFLSGGIDSSLVVALMRKVSAGRVRSFSIGFREQEFDESKHAAGVARHLGVEHTELIATPEEALAVVPKLSDIYDEPFGDSSQVPTYLVAKLSRQHVTVALSGDGGDELFCGYNRYLWWRSIWPSIRWVPLGMRRAVANAILARDPRKLDQLAGRFRAVLPRRLLARSPGIMMHKAAKTLQWGTPGEFYRHLVTMWQNADSLTSTPSHRRSVLDEPWPDGLDAATQRMMLLDIQTYLPYDILTKVDRATMAVSLESRSPLLDHRVVEFAGSIPLAEKVQGGVGKLILRQVLYRHVPRELIDRPKTGFGIPLVEWLRGPLRDWAESLLSQQNLDSAGILNPKLVRQEWQDLQSGVQVNGYAMWTLLMFQAWQQRWMRA